MAAANNAGVAVSNSLNSSQPYEVVCVGFGITSIANAVALHQRSCLKNALFLETLSEQEWNPSPRSAAARIRTSFLNDLITPENPRSPFTFLNYLHATGRLVAYANSSHIRPAREIFDDYLVWCAHQLPAQVEYGKRVMVVLPLKNSRGVVDGWRVVFSDVSTGKEFSVTAKQVVHAAPDPPKIPSFLGSPGIRPCVLHSSDVVGGVTSILKKQKSKARLAIIGDGQSAAEVFDHLQSIRGDHEVTWLTRDSTLKGDEKTPFILDDIKAPAIRNRETILPELRRSTFCALENAQTRSNVEPELLEQIYDKLYDQKVKEPDACKWKYQIKFQQEAIAAEKTPEGFVRLSIHTSVGQEFATFDTVVCATGYERNSQQRALEPLANLIDGRNVTIDREYHVNFRKGVLAPGCGLWLQGSLVEGDDSDDSLFPILAERSRRLAESVLHSRSEGARPYADSEGASARL